MASSVLRLRTRTDRWIPALSVHRICLKCADSSLPACPNVTRVHFENVTVLPIVLPWRFWSNMCEIARWQRWWHEKWSDVPMEAHSRSNVSYHSSRSKVLPRMSHSSHFWPGMDNGSLHSTSDDGHSGELKLQRAAAHGHPTHRLFTAHLTYPPAARAAVAPVGRSRAKLLFLHILCKSLGVGRYAVVVGLLLGTFKARGRTACHCPIPNIPCPSIHRLLFFKFWSFAQRRRGGGGAFDEGMPTF